MYGVVGHVKIDPASGEAPEKMLHDEVLPMVKQTQGFVAAYFLRSLDGASGTSIIVFESELDAKKAAEMQPPMDEGSPVQYVSNEVMRVVGQA